MTTNRAVIPMLDIITRLKTNLDAASDNMGIQFKINAQPNWKGTIGLRCNHVFFESVTAYLGHVCRELALHQAFPLLEHISISKAFATDPTTNRKRSTPWKRTLFITLRPGKELYALLEEKLPTSIDNYMKLEPLLAFLEELKCS